MEPAPQKKKKYPSVSQSLERNIEISRYQSQLKVFHQSLTKRTTMSRNEKRIR